MGYLRGNEDRDLRKDSEKSKASAFAQQVLGKVGGSLVYISPKKGGKLVDLS